MGILVGQSLAFHVHDRPLQVEPADKLGPLISHERGALADRSHGADASPASTKLAAAVRRTRCRPGQPGCASAIPPH